MVRRAKSVHQGQAASDLEARYSSYTWWVSHWRTGRSGLVLEEDGHWILVRFWGGRGAAGEYVHEWRRGSAFRHYVAAPGMNGSLRFADEEWQTLL